MEVRPATPPVAPPAAVPVFCKDCVHFNDKVAKSPPLCMAPLTQTINLVYGPQPNGCADARRNSICGKSGELFVLAHTNDAIGAVAATREPYAKTPASIQAPAYSPDEISHETPRALRHALWGYEDLTEIAKAKGRQSDEYKQHSDATLERIRPRLELILLAAIPALQDQAQTAHRQTSRSEKSSSEQCPVSEPLADLPHQTQG